MDYYEFMERAGVEITEAQYEKVLCVYMNHPSIRDVGDMVAFYNANGGMDAIELLYPVCKKLENALENAHHLENALQRAQEERSRFGQLMTVYKKYADTDRMMHDLEIDDIALVLYQKGVA
jgi:hypothetical protein